MRIMQLGKSAAYPSNKNWNVSYLIDLDGGYLLLETPPSIANQLNHAGVTVDQIDWIYISHRHGDHLLGLPMLLVDQYARKSDKLINIVTHLDVAQVARQLVTLVYPEIEEYMHDHTRFVILDESNHFSTPLTQGFSLRAAYGIHGVPSMAVRVQDALTSMVYSGDTARSETVEGLAIDSTLLIHEAGAAVSEKKKNHTSVAQAAQIAALSKCRQLWLTHLEETTPDFVATCVNEAMESFEGDISIVPDFHWITI